MHCETQASVEACLAQAWTFLTGEPIAFAEAPCTGLFAATSEHFMVTLHPASVDWRAGVVVSLAPGALDVPVHTGSEVCNVFSGCATRLFSKREDFVIGLPVRLQPEDMRTVLDRLVFSRCYTGAGGKVRVLAYETSDGSAAAGVTTTGGRMS